VKQLNRLAYLLAALLLTYAAYQLPGLLPGDYVTAMYAGSEGGLDAEQLQALRDRHAEQAGFLDYLGQLATLDWGHSLAHHEPVSRLIFAALPWTLLLMGCAHLLSTILGFIAGVEAAWRRGSRLEKVGVGGMTILQGVPPIGSGVLLLMIFSYQLGWLPAAGGMTPYVTLDPAARLLDLLQHLALPLLTLLLAFLPGHFLLARASMVLVLQQPFMEVAQAKGLSALRVRYCHGARNVLLPMTTNFGLRLASMMTGALVVETLFAYPGLGTLLFNAIAMRDLPLIQGIVLFSVLAVLAVNLVLDLLYARLDPRTKKEDAHVR